MKVLFLDIDGVLNSDTFYLNRPKEIKHLPHPLSEFDPTCVARLNRILAETKACLVVSSSWRHDPFIDRILDRAGIKPKMWDITPYGMGRPRGYEIKKFLHEHPDIENYVILDDVANMLPEQQSHFVQTKYYYGLTDEDAEKAINILNN